MQESPTGELVRWTQGYRLPEHRRIQGNAGHWINDRKWLHYNGLMWKACAISKLAFCHFTVSPPGAGSGVQFWQVPASTCPQARHFRCLPLDSDQQRARSWMLQG